MYQQNSSNARAVMLMQHIMIRFFGSGSYCMSICVENGHLFRHHGHSINIHTKWSSSLSPSLRRVYNMVLQVTLSLVQRFPSGLYTQKTCINVNASERFCRKGAKRCCINIESSYDFSLPSFESFKHNHNNSRHTVSHDDMMPKFNTRWSDRAARKSFLFVFSCAHILEQKKCHLVQ